MCFARLFFLNACGSYHEGLDLVESGSVAGAITLREVLDGQAATVGTAFVKLLLHGFEFERAIQLARRRILMGTDYAVVGDGTYSLVPVSDPGVVHLDRTGNRFRVTYESLAADDHGGSYSPPFEDSPRLQGTATRRVLQEDELRALLKRSSLPVIYDGTFYWSDDLASTLGRH